LIGARLNWMLHFGLPPRYAPNCRFIQIDISVEEMNNNVLADVNLVGDAKAIMSQLLAAHEADPWKLPKDSAWLAQLNQKVQQNKETTARLAKDNSLPMSYYRALGEIQRLVPDDAIIISEGANTMDISRTVILNKLPRHRLDAGTFGTMGVGIPFCLAAAVTHPTSKIVAIQGDSAFGFSAMELEVAARYKIPMVVIILNNNGIYSGLTKLIEGIPPPVNCLTPSAHYERIAEAFGGRGYFVNTPELLRSALEETFARLANERVGTGTPVVINVAIDTEGQRKEQKFGWLTRSNL